MAFKEKDFLEVNYTGKTKDEGMVFDTTVKEVAQAEGLFNPRSSYGALIVCLGEGQLLKGIDRQLIGKDIGTYTFDIGPEEGFGKKNAKLIQLIPTSKFKKENIMPHPHLQVNVDGQAGIIKTVSGGRTLVDFNHPLSGKELVYEVEVKRIIIDPQEKLKSMITLQLGIKNPEVEVSGKKAKVFFPHEFPKELAGPLSKSLQELVGLDEVSFLKKEAETK